MYLIYIEVYMCISENQISLFKNGICGLKGEEEKGGKEEGGRGMGWDSQKRFTVETIKPSFHWNITIPLTKGLVNTEIANILDFGCSFILTAQRLTRNICDWDQSTPYSGSRNY